MSAGCGTARGGTRTYGTRTYGTGAAALGAAGAMTAALGIVAAWGTVPASAKPVSIELSYTCAFRGIGTVPVTMRVSTDLPGSLEAGDSSPRAAVNGVATVDASFTGLAPLVGARTLEGSVDGTADVSAPHDDRRLSVPMTIPRTSIPASGAFDMSAKGTAPAVAFTRPGNAKVTVGDLGLHLTPRDAHGNLTPVGTMNAACTVDPGQNTVLHSLVVTKAVKPTGTVTGPGPGPGRETGPGPGPGRGTGTGPGTGPGAGAVGSGSGTSGGSVAGTRPGAGAARSTSHTTTTPNPSPSTTGSVPPRSPSPSPGAPTVDTPRNDPTSTPDGKHRAPDPKHPVALTLGVLVTGTAAALVGLDARRRKRRAED
ncbi:hypothetical protein SAMN05428954_6535 [Streptomyces sp. 2112.3]|uniref:DUF6801 domain-containing protein n=1 Tax=Streptomyces sp. 2112.3 TaxID=1881023 RepID=UPI000898085E|nr:DUF6801 domain-containing protein [Streptomyces sp. 2112.3]SEF12101.1 hypothetical protein SAMN05428954_6535 [Streptomyces sp. 2112.3]